MKEGDETGKACPDCDTPLIFEMGFQDMFSHKTGHYTIDRPFAVCPKCDYSEDYEKEECEYENGR